MIALRTMTLFDTRSAWYTSAMRRLVRALAAVAVATATVAGCAGNDAEIPANLTNPDEFLYERGTVALAEHDWLDAREYFRQIVDNYPQSRRRPDAKLGIGESYLGEGSTESLVLAASEFSEFLTFYPTSPRADYAQYQLAMTHYEQMKAPQRDQRATRDALLEFEAFFQRYPQSELIPDAREKWREARSRLSEAEYRVGLTYYRMDWYRGAIPRFRGVLEEDPQYPARDDVYFHLAESLARSDNTAGKERTAEAVTYLERLLTEFEQSPRLDDAQERLQELRTSLDEAPAPAPEVQQ